MKNIHYLLFLLAFISKAFFDVIFVENGIHSFDNIKYLFMLLDICLICYEENYKKKNNSNYKFKGIFYEEHKGIILVTLIFSLISMIEMVYLGTATIQTLKELFYLYIPGLYAFLLLNTLSENEINRYFNIMLVCFLGAYFIEISGKITLGNFESISYWDSYSPFESSYLAGPDISLFFYFLFKKDRIRTIISLIFVFMTFKRLAIVFACFMFILSKTCDLNKNVSKITIYFIKAFYIIIPVLIYYFMRPIYIDMLNAKFGIDFNHLVMSRDSIFNSVIDSGFQSYGYGSTTELVKKLYPTAGNLHLDLVKIFMETTIIGLVAFVNTLWNIAGTKRYSILIMLFCFFNLLTTHSIDGCFAWIITYLTIGTVKLQSNKKESLCYDRGTEKTKRFNKRYNPSI